MARSGTPVPEFTSSDLLPSSQVVIVALAPETVATEVLKNRSAPAGTSLPLSILRREVFEIAQRAAGDIGRDRGHQCQILLRLVPQDEGRAESLHHPRLRRIGRKRGIEYLRVAADANRLRGDARGSEFLRGRTPLAARRHEQRAHHQPRQDATDTAHTRSVLLRRSPATDTGPGIWPTDVNTHGMR